MSCRIALLSQRYDHPLNPITTYSMQSSSTQFLQLDYTLGRGVTNHPYHVSVVRAAITRNIAAKFDEMRDEVGRGYAQAFERLRNDSEGAVGEGGLFMLPIFILLFPAYEFQSQ